MNCVLGYFYLFTIYSFNVKDVPVSVHSFFAFSLDLHFSFLHLKRAHYLEGNIYVDPLVTWVPLKKLRSIIFLFYQFFLLEVLSKSHNFNIWQKNITHSIMANRIIRVHKLGKQNRNWPDITARIKPRIWVGMENMSLF